MQDEMKNSFEKFFQWYFASTPYFQIEWKDEIKDKIRFMEVVCLGGDYDDLTVSETICARFSDEEIQMLWLTE